MTNHEYMTKCTKHGCELKPLFTSSYCPRCDEEAAVNAPDVKEYAQKPASWEHGWFFCCPTVDSDQQVKEVAPPRHSSASVTLLSISLSPVDMQNLKQRLNGTIVADEAATYSGIVIRSDPYMPQGMVLRKWSSGRVDLARVEWIGQP